MCQPAAILAWDLVLMGLNLSEDMGLALLVMVLMLLEWIVQNAMVKMALGKSLSRDKIQQVNLPQKAPEE